MTIALAIALTLGTFFPTFAATTGALGVNQTQLTDQQKADLKAKRDDMKSKWSTLTDDQKNQIYSIQDQIATLQGQMADKYADFGIIGGDDANSLKAKITEKQGQMRSNGKMPMRGLYNKSGN